jgi:PAS domain S-box-containing protein
MNRPSHSSIECEQRTRLALRAFDALPLTAVVLGADGSIKSVNEEWWRFARANSSQNIETISPGAGYLEECRRAVRRGDPWAKEALEGIEAVLRGEISQFTLEYPCHSPEEKRWFLMSVKPLAGNSEILITHLDITNRRVAEDELRESETRYRSLFSSSLIAVLLTAPDGRIFAANEEACRMFGLTEPELIRAGRDGVADKTDPRLVAALEIRRHTGRFHGELTYVRKDGTKFIGETFSSIFLDLHGRQCSSMAIRDVTRRLEMEERLRQSEARLSLAINQTGLGTFDTDPGTGKSIWSESLFRLLGYEPHPEGLATTQMWAERIHPDDRQRVLRKCDAAKLERNLYRCEYRVSRADSGEVVWLAAAARFIYASQGEAVRFVGIVFDVTASKRTEQDLKELNERLDLTARQLVEKSQRLEELNSALRVLLKQKEEDRKDLEQSVVTNARNLIVPFLERLKQSPLSNAQSTWLQIVESHLSEITSPFAKSLSAQYANLTPAEIRIADFIREGRSTSQIAEVLGISEKTVCRHRENIRGKLGLRGKEKHLRSHLLSLE